LSLYLFTSWVQGAALVELFEKVAAMMDNSKRTGAALEAHYQFLVWLLPTVEKFPRSHKFTLGNRIETTALDVLEALIEATYFKERTQHQLRALAKAGFVALARARFAVGFLFPIFRRERRSKGDTLFSKLPAIATSTPYLTGWVPSVPRARTREMRESD